MAQEMVLVSQVRAQVTQLLDTVGDLNSLRAQYDALGGSAFVADAFEESDIDAAEFADALSSVAAINALLGQGHMTNLARLRV